MKKHLFVLVILFQASFPSFSQKEFIYVGTYSVRESKGIYVFELVRATGNLKPVQTITHLESPNFLAIHPSGKFLYSVNDGSLNKKEGYGSASAFSVDPKTGKLKHINSISSFGKGPCHITLDKTGEWAFISNYNEGNLVVVPILQDGSLGAPSDSKKYYGTSVNKQRQEQAHVHSAEVSADNKFVYVSDLGTDKIYVYAFDARNGRLASVGKGETSVAPGAGPRHFAIHPNGQTAYSSQELTSTVGVLRVDKTTGSLTVIQDTVKSLPPTAKETNTSAHIMTDPKGSYVYMSNRGVDVISVFSIKAEGKIQFAGTTKTEGKTPRNFLIDRRGRFAWVANQDSDNITIFRINPKNGLLTYTKLKAKVPSPVCIQQLIVK